MEKRNVTFLTFFLIWAKLQKWSVPLLHVRICVWLEECKEPLRVLMVFRGAAKSTIYAVYKAWRLYCDRTNRSLIWAADGKLAKKLSRDTLNVLRRHPLCGGMLPPKPGVQTFWVNGANDARNASIDAVGVDQNATGARADDVDYDDIEVPKNIKTSDARENLRAKIEESTHIAVPGAQETFIGTPHTHNSIYSEKIEEGAAVLKIPLFEHMVRYEQTDVRTRYKVPFPIGDDGLYVMTGIGKFSKMLVENVDYRLVAGEIIFDAPPRVTIDICSMCVWPERFDRKDIEQRRKRTKTLNAWDSQYFLESKPISETRLDPMRIIPYAMEPIIRVANKVASMYLGEAKIAGCAARWDPSSAKPNSDVSAFALVFQDTYGKRYMHRNVALTGEVVEWAADGKTISGGQVWQICDLVEKYHIPRIGVETNGVGAFAPAILKGALKQRKLRCAVKDVLAIENKNKLILEAYEPVMSANMLWAHMEVLEGEFWDQMKDFNPGTRNQADDYLDAGAAAITDMPERITVHISEQTATPEQKNWRPASGVHEAEYVP